MISYKHNLLEGGEERIAGHLLPKVISYQYTMQCIFSNICYMDLFYI